MRGGLLDWLNFGVSFLTLVCVAWYLRETHKTLLRIKLTPHTIN
jgi:hypothetical protein